MDDLEKDLLTRQALDESIQLSTELLRNLEMSELPLSNIALRTSRLARLLNDNEWQRIMEYEVSGYPSTATGLTPEVWKLAGLAGRQNDEFGKKVAYTEGIEHIEEQIRELKTSLTDANKRTGTFRSSYPTSYEPDSFRMERMGLHSALTKAYEKLNSRRTVIHQYLFRKYHELKFSGTVDDIFSRTRNRVDSIINTLLPNSTQRFIAVYDNLRSKNPEDWSNAVHSCRRILQDLADVLFPPTDSLKKTINGEIKEIKLGKDQYINRIIAYVEQNSASDRFNSIVGSELNYLGDRLDAIFQATQKGSHDTIMSRDEADRYVIYTYLIVGDLLSLTRAKVYKVTP